MLSYKLDFNYCAIRDSFRKFSHKYYCAGIMFGVLATYYAGIIGGCLHQVSVSVSIFNN